ncbi:5-formyltetrahydrofolate cyclo-ligase [hydrothermal vent metagenome]|uniref:5-formyltetrahydrofolate cyclo-ligase n=1 Tax=hydrothermal vent metagenome TaxID=652676 RepID=A0A3B0RBD5_9ZZZZ
MSGFIPYRSEIDITGLLKVLAAKGCITCLPIVTEPGQPLIFRQWQPGDQTEAGAWNIPVPLPTASLIEPDILLVPLLAFDQTGYRLGYGGGFYDRTISQLKKTKNIITIGVAYSAQQITNVPKDQHDQQLSWILTEKGPIKCG